MKKLLIIPLLLLLIFTGCNDGRPSNTSVLDEQAKTELNQRNLLINQPLPEIKWSMERDNLTKYALLQNDRTVNFFLYVFLEGYGCIGYYQVNKVSSVSSALTNPEQIIDRKTSTPSVVSSPQLDGSYGTNGDGMFGFTPEGIMVQTNMKYITATVPLQIKAPLLAIITNDEMRALLENSKKVMNQKK